MLKDLFKKVDYYWVLFILTVILCFGFFLTNSSMGIDDEMLNWYGSLVSAVSIGRIGRIFQYVIGYEYIPFFYDFLGILLYSIAIVLNSDCFMRFINGFSKKQAVVFSCISISFPFIAFLFAFMVITVHIGAALLAVSCASYLFCKYLFLNADKKSLLLSISCLIFSISLYETSIIYFLINILFIIFMNSKSSIKYALKTFFTAAGAVYIYLITLKITKAIMGINYDRSREFVKYDFTSITGFIQSFNNSFKELIHNYLSTINHNFGSFMIALSVIIFLLIILYVSIKRKSFIYTILGIIILFLPLTTFFMTGNSGLYYRVYASFGYLIGMTFAFLFKFNNKIVCYLLTLAAVFIVLNQAKEINRIFYTEHLKFQDDLAFARFIMHDLGSKKLGNKPVVFAGKKEEIILKNQYYVEAPEIMISNFTWDKYNSEESEFFVYRGYNFINHHGIKIVPFNKYNKDTMEVIKKQIPQMNTYPNEGYIKDMGDFVIIKIGKSVYDE